MALILGPRDKYVLAIYGVLLGGNSIKSIACVNCVNWQYRREIDLNPYEVIAQDNTVSESMINSEFAFDGKKVTLMKSKLQTITKLKGRRLPTDRPPTHPGEMLLEEFLKPLGISQSAFAVRLGVSFPRLNEVINGKRCVTPDTALRLAQVLGMPADFWLGLQSDWDLWHAMRTEKAEKIAQLEPLPDLICSE